MSAVSDPQPPYGAVPPPAPPPPPGGPSGPGVPFGGPPQFPPPPPPGGPAAGGRKALWIVLAAVGALALVGLLVAIVLLATRDGDDRAADRDVAAASATGREEASSGATPSEGSPGEGGPGGESSADAVPNEPAAVTEAFVDSFFSDDCATANDLVTEAFLAEEGRCEPGSIPSVLAAEIEYRVGDATVDEDAGTATVPVTVTAEGRSETGDVYLEKVDGRWLVSGASDGPAGR